MRIKKFLINTSFLISILTTILLLNSCKKDPCETKVCQNGGFCDDGTCKCPEGFSGTNCEIDNRPACQKNNTGQIVFDNYSSNPYDCYVNNIYKGRVSGYGFLSVTITSGYYSLRTLQVSGYVLYPSEFTGAGTVARCGNLTFKFP